jgi:hypothetical protein
MSLRFTEQEYAAYLRRGEPAPVSEAAWQASVLRLLRQHGYDYVYHTFDSRRSPSGFPDVIACHREPGHVCYAIECKTDTGQVTPAQAAWLEALAGCTGVVADIWRPSALDAIVTLLRA